MCFIWTNLKKTFCWLKRYFFFTFTIKIASFLKTKIDTMKTVQVVSTNKVLRIAKEENRNIGQKQKKSRVRGLFLSYQNGGLVEEEAILRFFHLPDPWLEILRPLPQANRTHSLFCASQGHQADPAFITFYKHLEFLHCIIQNAQQSHFYLNTWLIIISQQQIASQCWLKEVYRVYKELSMS